MTENADPSFDPAKLRASNADREAVAKVLEASMAEGRLTVAELQERLDTVYGAKTLSELERVTWDLPGHKDLVPQAPPAPRLVKSTPPAATSGAVDRIGGTPTSSLAVGILSGATRNGAWVVPAQFSAMAIMGGVDLDLTQARFAEQQVTITAVAVMGGIDIVVPPDVTVVVNGIGLMGAFEDHARVQGPPGCPVIKVNGLALMGGVDIKLAKRAKGEIES